LRTYVELHGSVDPVGLQSVENWRTVRLTIMPLFYTCGPNEAMVVSGKFSQTWLEIVVEKIAGAGGSEFFWLVEFLET